MRISVPLRIVFCGVLAVSLQPTAQAQAVLEQTLNTIGQIVQNTAQGQPAVSIAGSALFGVSLSISQEMEPGVSVRLTVSPPQNGARLNTQVGGYDLKVSPRLGYTGVFGDWRIGQGPWRLSVGVAAMQGRSMQFEGRKTSLDDVSASANQGLALNVGSSHYTAASGSQYQAGGQTWTMQNDGSVTSNTGASISKDDLKNAVPQATMSSSVQWPRIMPYIGVGYDSQKGNEAGWSFFADLGTFIGRPKVVSSQFSTSCASAACSILTQTLNRQTSTAQTQLQQRIKRYSVLPQLSIGAKYTF